MEETYQEVIDAYNLSSEKKQGMSLTDYIKRNNIKIKDIDTTPEKKSWRRNDEIKLCNGFG